MIIDKTTVTRLEKINCYDTYGHTAPPHRFAPGRLAPPASSPLVARLLVTGAFAHHHAVRRGVLLGELGHRRAAPGLE